MDEPQLKGGIWHVYWAGGQKDPTLSDLLHEKQCHYKLHFPFLTPRQHLAKAYQELGIPHLCGEVDRAKLRKMYLETKKTDLPELAIQPSKQGKVRKFFKRLEFSIKKRITPKSQPVQAKAPNLQKPVSGIVTPAKLVEPRPTPRSLKSQKSVTFQERVKIIDISPNPSKKHLYSEESLHGSTPLRGNHASEPRTNFKKRLESAEYNEDDQSANSLSTEVLSPSRGVPSPCTEVPVPSLSSEVPCAATEVLSSSTEVPSATTDVSSLSTEVSSLSTGTPLVSSVYHTHQLSNNRCFQNKKSEIPINKNCISHDDSLHETDSDVQTFQNQVSDENILQNASLNVDSDLFENNEVEVLEKEKSDGDSGNTSVNDAEKYSEEFNDEHEAKINFLNNLSLLKSSKVQLKAGSDALPQTKDFRKKAERIGDLKHKILSIKKRKGGSIKKSNGKKEKSPTPKEVAVESSFSPQLIENENVDKSKETADSSTPSVCHLSARPASVSSDGNVEPPTDDSISDALRGNTIEFKSRSNSSICTSSHDHRNELNESSGMIYTSVFQNTSIIEKEDNKKGESDKFENKNLFEKSDECVKPAHSDSLLQETKDRQRQASVESIPKSSDLDKSNGSFENEHFDSMNRESFSEMDLPATNERAPSDKDFEVGDTVTCAVNLSSSDERESPNLDDFSQQNILPAEVVDSESVDGQADFTREPAECRPDLLASPKLPVNNDESPNETYLNRSKRIVNNSYLRESKIVQFRESDDDSIVSYSSSPERVTKPNQSEANFDFDSSSFLNKMKTCLSLADKDLSACEEISKQSENNKIDCDQSPKTLEFSETGKAGGNTRDDSVRSRSSVSQSISFGNSEADVCVSGLIWGETEKDEWRGSEDLLKADEAVGGGGSPSEEGSQSSGQAVDELTRGNPEHLEEVSTAYETDKETGKLKISRLISKSSFQSENQCITPDKVTCEINKKYENNEIQSGSENKILHASFEVDSEQSNNKCFLQRSIEYKDSVDDFMSDESGAKIFKNTSIYFNNKCEIDQSSKAESELPLSVLDLSNSKKIETENNENIFNSFSNTHRQVGAERRKSSSVTLISSNLPGEGSELNIDKELNDIEIEDIIDQTDDDSSPEKKTKRKLSKNNKKIFVLDKIFSHKTAIMPQEKPQLKRVASPISGSIISNSFSEDLTRSVIQRGTYLNTTYPPVSSFSVFRNYQRPEGSLHIGLKALEAAEICSDKKSSSSIIGNSDSFNYGKNNFVLGQLTKPRKTDQNQQECMNSAGIDSDGQTNGVKHHSDVVSSNIDRLIDRPLTHSISMQLNDENDSIFRSTEIENKFKEEELFNPSLKEEILIKSESESSDNKYYPTKWSKMEVSESSLIVNHSPERRYQRKRKNHEIRKKRAQLLKSNPEAVHCISSSSEESEVKPKPPKVLKRSSARLRQRIPQNKGSPGTRELQRALDLMPKMMSSSFPGKISERENESGMMYEPNVALCENKDANVSFQNALLEKFSQDLAKIESIKNKSRRLANDIFSSGGNVVSPNVGVLNETEVIPTRLSERKCTTMREALEYEKWYRSQRENSADSLQEETSGRKNVNRPSEITKTMHRVSTHPSVFPCKSEASVSIYFQQDNTEDQNFKKSIENSSSPNILFSTEESQNRRRPLSDLSNLIENARGNTRMLEHQARFDTPNGSSLSPAPKLIKSHVALNQMSLFHRNDLISHKEDELTLKSPECESEIGELKRLSSAVSWGQAVEGEGVVAGSSPQVEQPQPTPRYVKSSIVRWKDMSAATSHPSSTPEIETLFRRTFFMKDQ